MTNSPMKTLLAFVGLCFSSRIQWAQSTVHTQLSTKRSRGKGGKQAHKVTGARKIQRAAAKARNRAR